MHLQMQRDVWLERHKFATVYPAIYCRKPNVITLRHFSLVDKWIYAAGKQFYAAGSRWTYSCNKVHFHCLFKAKMLIALE